MELKIRIVILVWLEWDFLYVFGWEKWTKPLVIERKRKIEKRVYIFTHEEYNTQQTHTIIPTKWLVFLTSSSSLSSLAVYI